MTDATGGRPRTSSSFDRIAPPDPARTRRRDGTGKEALYSTAPTAAPAPQVELRCRSCGVPVGTSVLGLVRLVAVPFLVDPLRRRLWTRCPACDRRTWLELRMGPALRVLLERGPRP